MKVTKFILAVTFTASAFFVTEQEPVIEKNVAQDIAGVCPAWPICRGEVKVDELSLDSVMQESLINSSAA